jgi:pyruvate formate lyase activating enzyme
LWQRGDTIFLPSTYFEYAYDVAKLASERGLKTVFVSNGFMSDQALEMIAPYLAAANVDLKSFNSEFYRNICKGDIDQVKRTIRSMVEREIWVEVTTLLIPGENDNPNELKQLAGFLADLSRDIPWHISRFHPDYNFTDYGPTLISTLERAYRIGKDAGLNHVYLGNVMSDIHTLCSNCGSLLIERSGFGVRIRNLSSGKCTKCNTKLAGIFVST